MRIYNRQGEQVLDSVTLFLTPAELQELADGAQQLSANHDLHHVHVTDASFSREITLSVHMRDNMASFDDESRSVIDGSRSGRREPVESDELKDILDDLDGFVASDIGFDELTEFILDAASAVRARSDLSVADALRAAMDAYRATSTERHGRNAEAGPSADAVRDTMMGDCES